VNAYAAVLAVAKQANPTDSADGLALAGINGTILAIFIAAALGYLLIAIQSLHALSARYVERANRAKDLQFRMRFHSVAFPAERLAWNDLDTVVMLLAMGHPGPLRLEASGEEIPLPDPSDEAGRGKVLATVLPRIATSPPFLDWGGSLALKDEAAVREWRKKFEVAVRFLTGNRNMSEGRFREMAVAADARDLEESGGIWRGGSNTRVVDEFEKFVDRAIEIDRDAAADEEAIDLSRRRLPSRRLRGTAVVLLLFTFVCGVAIPMTHPSVSSIIDAWIPATVYTLCLALAGLRVWRR
jgi:hypothetical protein